jgi:peroxiredoxin
MCKLELGELQSAFPKFAERNTTVYVISLEGQALAQESQAEWPNLCVVSDQERRMAEAFQVIHPNSAPDGGDTSAPTTFLLDGAGRVRWTFRPDRVVVRLSPGELLAAVDQHLKK